jgi:hypothetical protein
MTFEFKIHGLHLRFPFLRGLYYGPLTNGVQVKDLELIRYRINEA